MPPIIIQLKDFDPKKTIDQQEPIGNTAFGYISQDSGFIQVKKDIKDFDPGALSAGGRIVISEIRVHAFGFAEDEILRSQLEANDQAGDGRYILPIIDAGIATNSDGDRRASQELVLRNGDPTRPLGERTKGGFSFNTFAPEAEVGAVVPYQDTIDDIRDEFLIVEVNFTIIGGKLDRAVKCAKTVQKTVTQIAVDAFRSMNKAIAARRIDNGTT